MARPLRIEFAGVLYHITSRGNGREAIYLRDNDRDSWLEVFGEVCRRFNWVCYAYCLMGNHYHLLVETPEGNMSMGMRQLNGVYTQRFNRAHGRVGHVFQGRYKAVLVDKDDYLLELCRYIVLNPVRAQMVRTAKDWRWSSYRATAGLVEPFPWLQSDWVLGGFGRRRASAIRGYRTFVAAGKGQPSPWKQLKNQIYLGDDTFVERMQAILDPDASLDDIPAIQKRAPRKLMSFYEGRAKTRDQAILEAYQSGGYKMKELADYFSLHYSSVSKIIRKLENSRRKT